MLTRVKLSRLSVDFAILERGRLQSLGKMPLDKSYMALVAARFQPFFAALAQSQVVRLREGQPLDKEVYRRDLAKDLQIKL